MKFLKFAGVYLGFAALIFLIVIGYNWKEFKNVFRNNEGLTEGKHLIEKTFSLGGIADFIKENPEYVSVYSLPLNSDSAIVSIQETTPRTAGILSSAFIVLHYIHAKQTGLVSGEELVPIDSVNAWQVPNLYRTAHEKTIQQLEENKDLQNGEVHLEALVNALVYYNSLGVYDYLLNRFTPSAIMETANQFGFTDELHLMPFSGLSIQLHPNLVGENFDAQLDSLRKLSAKERASKVFLSSHAYVHNPTFRTKVMDTFKDYDAGITFLEEKESFNVYPKIRPIALVQLVKEALKGNQLTASSKKELLNLLDWPMSDRAVAYQFGYYGGIFENRMSICSGLDIAYSKDGKDTLVQAVIFDQIPIALWFHMSSKYINLDYQRRIVWDEELRTRTMN